jgi:hypothetical protein|tara:strand:+ start:2428 stop:2889 length:462 start_codon:yes stop_codon:yes gene_type:complete
MNSDLLPLDIDELPWLYESKNDLESYDVGKWMLFYDKSKINDAWQKTKTLYRNDELEGVMSMKCSTSFNNPRANNNDSIIILYCNNSCDEETIMNTGKNMLKLFKYEENETIYYKTDEQTKEGTGATGSTKNHTYKIVNPYYKTVYLIDSDSD